MMRYLESMETDLMELDLSQEFPELDPEFCKLLHSMIQFNPNHRDGARHLL